MHKAELLAPASNLESLKVAISYGADAVYIGGEAYGLEASIKGFTIDELKEGIEFVHGMGKKLYVTVNVLPHNNDFNNLESFLKNIDDIGVDAVIASDAGIVEAISNIIPNMEIHLGSQANVTNYASAKFWHSEGVKRVVVTRELSCEEIAQIRANSPLDLDIESFVHGDICISYSGRSLISSYLRGNNKDINISDVLNEEYKLMEEKRPGEYYPVYEDERGTFLYNSKDLCMIGNIADLIKSGVTSLKIEARNKDLHYIASIVRVYRSAIDKFYKDSSNWRLEDIWLEEIRKGSNRDFTTGFFISGNSEEASVDIIESAKPYDYVGIVKNTDENGLATIELSSKVKVNEKLEIIGPNMDAQEIVIEEILNEASTDENIVKLKLTKPVSKYCILRRDI